MDNELGDLASISGAIRTARKSMGLSQAQVAKMCKMSQSMIARLERDIDALNPSYSAVYTVMKSLAESEEIGKRDLLLNKKAHEIMRRNVVFLHHGDTVDKAISIVQNYDFTYIPVLGENGTVEGTIDRNSLLELATNRPSELSEITIHSIVGPALPKVDRDTPISSLKHILGGSGAAIVVDKAKAIGIITAYDVLKLV